jgi:hypothetical protein
MTAFPLSNTTVRIPTLLLDRLHQGLPSRTRAATIRMIVTNYCMQEQRPILPQVAALTKRGEKLSRRRQLAAALGCKSCTNPVYLGLPRRELAMWRDYAKQVGFSSVSCLVSHALAAHLGVSPKSQPKQPSRTSTIAPPC